MDTFEIQTADTPEKIDLIAGLAKAIWNEYYPPIIGQAQVDYMVSRFQSAEAMLQQLSEGYEYYLLQHDHQNVGYCAIVLRPDGELFLSKLYLDKAHRGMGLAWRALLFIQQRAEKLGATHISLTVNKDNIGAINAYEKFGFRKTAKMEIDIGDGFIMDDYRMEKSVDF